MCHRHIIPSFLSVRRMAPADQKIASVLRKILRQGAPVSGLRHRRFDLPLPYRKRRAALSQKTHFSKAKRESGARTSPEQSAKVWPGDFTRAKRESVPARTFAEQSGEVLPGGGLWQSKAGKSCPAVDFGRAKRKSPAHQRTFAEQSGEVCPRQTFAEQSGKAARPAYRKRRKKNADRYLDFRARRSDESVPPGRWDKPPPEGGTP